MQFAQLVYTASQKIFLQVEMCCFASGKHEYVDI